MARLELTEREIVITQSAQDRRDGVWHIWSNDPYWHRRLEKVDATVVKSDQSSKTYQVRQRQILVRKVPAARQGSGNAQYLRRGQSAAEDVEDFEIDEEAVEVDER